MNVWTVLLFISSSLAFGKINDRQNEIISKLKKVQGLTDNQVSKLLNIFSKAPHMGQGNPSVTKHPLTEDQCHKKLKKLGVNHANPEFTKICGQPFMAPLYNPNSQKMSEAKVCIDQFEFPNLPCDYPVTWVRADEAAAICEAMDKRLCDAHEWEGACDGKLLPPDYQFEKIKGLSANAAQKKLRRLHNNKEKNNKSWAYGSGFQKGICAQASFKHKDCNGGNYKKCGTNTYPAGAFPKCSSRLKVYDLHGNAAEHMNLPLTPEQMASHKSRQYGHTEMKGSWFIWDSFQAHPDWCRWRAPYWHGTTVAHPKSHHNYHLGFRCCRDR